MKKEASVHSGPILDIIYEMVSIAKKGNFTVKMEHNGVTVLVNGDSNAELIFRDQQRAQRGYIAGEVGPYPKAKLTNEDKANDMRVEAESERKWQKFQREYQAEYDKVRARRERVEAKLVNAPAFKPADEVEWQKFKDRNKDGTAGRIVTYVERWARLMQIEMANGKNLEEVADATSQEADFEGMTGNTYGHAVVALAGYWKYGDQLRRWHNIKTQRGNEGEEANESGGVLNPAI